MVFHYFLTQLPGKWTSSARSQSKSTPFLYNSMSSRKHTAKSHSSRLTFKKKGPSEQEVQWNSWEQTRWEQEHLSLHVTTVPIHTGQHRSTYSICTRLCHHYPSMTENRVVRLTSSAFEPAQAPTVRITKCTSGMIWTWPTAPVVMMASGTCAEELSASKFWYNTDWLS